MWRDANSDGQTDAGELSTLASLGISSIGLIPTANTGEILSGNEILGRGTMVKNGVTQATASVNFLTNPAGHEWNLEAEGFHVNSEGGTSSFSVTDTAGAVVDVAAKGVQSAYGNIGNDMLAIDAEEYFVSWVDDEFVANDNVRKMSYLICLDMAA